MGPLCAVALEKGLIDARKGELLRASSLPMEANIDRNGVLDFGLACRILDPMPRRDRRFRMTFAEVMDEAAAGIIAEGEPFAAYWSGGLDSTGVVSAFLRQGVSPAQMTVVLNTSSIAEYPAFYERFLRRYPNVRMIAPSVWPDVRYGEVMVTGELGDQIFGSVWVTLYDEDFPDRGARWHSMGGYADCLTKHWHHHIRRKYDAPLHADLIAMYEPLVAAAPFAVKTVYDFLWWVNFSTKWQHVVMRMASGMKSLPQYLANNRPFYRSMAFQQWSMNEQNHREHKTARHVDSYKLALRRYIEAFTGDADYANHKKKVGSLPMKINRRYMMVLDSGERVRFGDHACEDVAEYTRKYGSRFDYLFSGEGQHAVAA